MALVRFSDAFDHDVYNSSKVTLLSFRDYVLGTFSDHLKPGQSHYGPRGSFNNVSARRATERSPPAGAPTQADNCVALYIQYGDRTNNFWLA